MLAQRLAREKSQQQVDALHLLLALLNQEDSLVFTLLKNLQLDIDDLKRRTEKALNVLVTPKAPPAMGQFYLTQDLAAALERAREEALQMADEFIAVEHLFLGLLAVPSRAQDVLSGARFLSATILAPLTRDTILKKLKEIRGGEKVTDPDPESKFEVIKKYSRNLTEMAREGKLDPVVGRETEIRRLDRKSVV